eukprot:TRINITY_DN270_c0_g2_i1.p1 TRINITY_DN270_c0_g2~~TRINITY_DN270_c0_g2_i1.p1  ORF type:complete len:201 (-),score=55.76 TRINITY_DN270_c0_g2_i1:425-1027(-)
MSGSKSNPVGVDSTFRRKWDTSKYEGVQYEDSDDDQPKKPANWGVRRAPLQGRVEKVDIDSNVGKTVIVSNQTPLRQQAGYYCDVCDCLVKDSMNYLDHINGRNHQRALGMSMRVERSTVDQVKNRLQMAKKKSTEKIVSEDVEDRLRRRAAEEEEKKRMKKDKKSESRAQDEDNAVGDGDADEAVMAALGFGGFGSSKK